MLTSDQSTVLLIISTHVLVTTLLPSGECQSPPRLLTSAYEPEKIVPEGTNVQLPCPVQADPDTLFFEWFKDKEPLITFGEERHRISPSGTLRIKSTVHEDTGQYMCRAVNGFGRVDVNITLVVLSTPDSIRPDTEEEDFESMDRADSSADNADQLKEEGKPRFTHVTKFSTPTVYRPVGSSVHLKCLAEATPRPRITWLKNGKELPDNPKKGRWMLHLQNLQASDSGNYSCLVYNGLGSIGASFSISVVDRVRTKPELTGTHPLNTTVDYGGTAVLQCRVRSDGPPHVQWLKRIEKSDAEEEGHIIKVQGEHFRILKSTDVTERLDGSFLNKLEIRDAVDADSGKYTCVEANSMGYSFRSAFLTVLTRAPSEPQGPSSSSSLPIPIVASIAVAGALLFVAVLVLVFYCRSRRSSPTPRGPSSKSSVSTETKHTYVGMAYNPEFSLVKDTVSPPARVYLPAPSSVPLNSIFL